MAAVGRDTAGVDAEDLGDAQAFSASCDGTGWWRTEPPYVRSWTNGVAAGTAACNGRDRATGPHEFGAKEFVGLETSLPSAALVPKSGGRRVVPQGPRPLKRSAGCRAGAASMKWAAVTGGGDKPSRPVIRTPFVVPAWL